MSKSELYALNEPIRNVENYIITSGLGWRSDPISGARSYHDGIDLGTPTGVECLAMEDGTVIYGGLLYGFYPYLTGTLYGDAQVVRIQYDNGLISQHAHLSRVDVVEGDRVVRGQVVGLTGATGYVTGAHLHMQLWEGSAMDSNAVDFFEYLGYQAPNDFNEQFYLWKYPDVKEAVRAGYFRSGRQHYMSFGKSEQREFKPSIPSDYNENVYLKYNPDVEEAVRMGWFSSGADHWLLYGYSEGRKYAWTSWIDEIFDRVRKVVK